MVTGHDRIREYSKEDKPGLLELWHEFDKAHVESDPERFKFPTQEQMELRLEKYAAEDKGSLPRTFTFVSETEHGILDGFICGMIRRTPDAALLNEMTVIEIHGIYASGNRHKTGEEKTSHSLVKKVLEFGKNAGAKKAVCGIWEFNGSSKKLFSKCGFTRVSSRYEIKVQ